eukprot:CAMPEP_0194106012 /NCGR_PEP_ID=MMETSP0150-20130528/6119_1 /TAXON_ID=122233 /ORGANISM="Chaetoceros debilis, Strain MM31A-1" /LENGTH=644 /DNA_ID=CAMNT_0038794047 /DNA_START=640 /DNA_END=2574 /DNA_ORIENTATION=+
MTSASRLSESGSTIYDISIEECNARFAKIAEAYEILCDESKRREYDQILLDTEESLEREYNKQNRQSAKQKQSTGRKKDQSSSAMFQSASTMFQDFVTDPMSVFEEFFFGTSEMKGPTNFMEDLFANFYKEKDSSQQSKQDNHKQKTRSQRRQASDTYRGRQPDRTFASKTSKSYFDPRFGTDVMRVVQREEFDDHSMDRIYFRVVEQEFIEEFDYYGRTLRHTPISEPYVVEEGYVAMKKSKKKRTSSQYKNQRRRSPLNKESHRLEKNEFITPQTVHLRSLNGDFYAGLTLECELVIMRDEGPSKDDTFVWSSNTYAPPQHQKECALAMFGTKIAVVVGNVDNPKTVLWNSPSAPPLSPDDSAEEDDEQLIEYYCSLDNDGNLAVYRTREVIKLSSVSKNDMISIAEMFWSDILSNDAQVHPDSQAKQTWNMIRQWAVLKARQKPKESKKDRTHMNSRARRGQAQSNLKNRQIDECVYATGIAGCITPGRNVINMSKKIQQSVGKAGAKIDSTVTGIVDSIYEGSEEDLDLLDTCNRVFTNVSNSLKSALEQLRPKIFDFLEYAIERLRSSQNLEMLKDSLRKVLNILKKWTKVLRYEAADYGKKIRHELQIFCHVVKNKATHLFEQVEHLENDFNSWNYDL